MRSGGLMPRVKPSATETSICVSLRSGPSTRTLAICPFGPRIVTVSSAAYWPGCFIAFIRVSSEPGPKSASMSGRERWMWRFDTPIGTSHGSRSSAPFAAGFACSAETVRLCARSSAITRSIMGLLICIMVSCSSWPDMTTGPFMGATIHPAVLPPAFAVT
ncbi:hypothetical protein D3C73_716330 [compost metagenome]